MNLFLIVGVGSIVLAVVLFIIYLVLTKGTGRRLRKQLQKEYGAK